MSHSSELIDGDRHREPLTLLGGTVSLGGLAVDGFFIISGYLITKSWVQRSNTSDFLIKRFFRIVPGYGVAFAACALIIAPFAGAGTQAYHPHQFLRLLAEFLRLLSPSVPNVFAGLAYPALNGSLWTIAYEMRCYVFSAVVGLLGLYSSNRQGLFMAFVAVLLLIVVSGFSIQIPDVAPTIVGAPVLMIRLLAMFGSGASFYLLNNLFGSPKKWAFVAGFGLALTLRYGPLTELGIAVFGGYLIFWAAFSAPQSRWSRYTNRTDVSYGVYLYAFPIQQLLIWFLGINEPWLLTTLSVPAALTVGFVSWKFVERPSMEVASRWVSLRAHNSRSTRYA